MPKSVEVDRFKLVLENFHDLLLEETNKLGIEVCNLGGNLTLSILVILTCLGPRPLSLGRVSCGRRGGSDPSFRFPPEALQLELGPRLYGVPFRLHPFQIGLSPLQVGFGLQQGQLKYLRILG